jgi:hypothetical protein
MKINKKYTIIYKKIKSIFFLIIGKTSLTHFEVWPLLQIPP